jgi:hypothetical protein
MGRRKDRFAGNAQQDAQEFLTAFLEGVNEEMTRVKVKPKYKELQGDPTKDSIRNIVYCFLFRPMSGGVTESREMTQWSATTFRDRLNVPSSVRSVSSDPSVSITSGACH